MKQARAADRARARGANGPLLGIPIAIKNNYDTFDMATTNGSFTFEGFLPARDAFQVARLREAGAVIIGKTGLEEYATFGHWSNDAWGQVWNVHLPSKSPLASSGGSASAVAGSFAAAAMGSQTGDSLYAPASGASLVTLRGTDGLESGSGIQPLVWMTDFGGAITRSVSDLADMLNIVTGIDPDDPATLAPAGGRRAGGLALRARPQRPAGQTHRLRRLSVGRCLRTGDAAIRDQQHDRRHEGCAQVPRGCGRDDRPNGPARESSDTGRTAGAGAADSGQQNHRRRVAAVHRQPSRTAHAGLLDPHRGRRGLLAEEGALRARRAGDLPGDAAASVDAG